MFLKPDSHLHLPLVVPLIRQPRDAASNFTTKINTFTVGPILRSIYESVYKRESTSFDMVLQILVSNPSNTVLWNIFQSNC